MSKGEETYYDILKVDPKATIAEIVAAYHSAKNAFSKDSVATYSLFNPEEVQAVLGKLEEAYLTLSNIEKRVEYDRLLLKESGKDAGRPTMTELEKMQNAQSNVVPIREPEPTLGGTSDRVVSLGGASEPLTGYNLEDINGAMLKEIREKRGLSVEDVCRITKIPSKFLSALESDSLKKLPARVYVQGFVKNMAVLYRLDPKGASQAYLAYLDKMGATP